MSPAPLPGRGAGLGRPAPACYLCEQAGETLYRQERDRLYGAPGAWDIRVCRQCGLAWVDPRPVAEAIPILYGACYYTHKLNTAKPVLGHVRAVVGNAVLAARLGYRELSRGWLHLALGWLVSWLPMVYEGVQLGVMGLAASRRGQLIDVGCGNGAFLARMKELGWSVAGVEPDPEAVRVAREHFGLSVFQGTLAEARLPEASADAITVHHVLEHVLDPIDFLSECYRVLRPGGLLIAVVPNLKSLGRHVFRSCWLHWDVPRHIFVFSPESVRRCLEQAGFRAVATWTSVRGARWTWAESRALKRWGMDFAHLSEATRWRLRLEGSIFQLLEWALRAVGPFGEEVVAVATKYARLSSGLA